MQQDISDFFLDLRGIECPMNFVKTKIQLEKMKQGQILEIFLDLGEAIDSVPSGVLEEGHKITRQIEENGYFKLFIQKS